MNAVLQPRATAGLANTESLDPQLRELYRKATPTEKLAVVGRLNATLLRLKAAEIEKRHPEAPAATRRQMLRRWWLAATD